MLALFWGFTQRILLRMLIRDSLACQGIQYLPAFIMSYSQAELEWSNGRNPKHMAYSMIPELQISILEGSQTSPLNISGAAQQGLPHAVLRVSPLEQILLSPKSIILTLNLQSRSTFQGFRSRCTTPISCRYQTALRICWRYLHATNSDNFYYFTIWSKSSPLLANSVTTQQQCWSQRISQSWMMLGWRTFRRILSYFMSRWWSAVDLILLLSMSLMATCYLEWVCLAILTLLKVPQPIVFPKMKLPIRFPSSSLAGRSKDMI